jgi:pyruvate, orthophosphate dikinase
MHYSARTRRTRASSTRRDCASSWRGSGRRTHRGPAGSSRKTPPRQLGDAVVAVLCSWNSDRAVTYRRLQGLSDHDGTAVTVQAMVFGNLGITSGSGVGFTRDPATGENQPYIDFLLNAQGEDVVAGRTAAEDSAPLIAAVPGLAQQLETVRHSLERLFADAQDFEFTVEDGNLWLLQTRPAKRSPWAGLQIACDLVEEGIIDRRTALQHLSSYDLSAITRTRLADADDALRPVGRATPAGLGVATGRIALHPGAANRYAAAGEPVILVRDHAATEDIGALAACVGLLTATGARTSHAAVVARQLGVVCLVNCPDLAIDLAQGRARIGAHEFNQHDKLTLDAATGCIYAEELRVIEERPTQLLTRVRQWQRSARSHAPSPSNRSSPD